MRFPLVNRAVDILVEAGGESIAPFEVNAMRQTRKQKCRSNEKQPGEAMLNNQRRVEKFCLDIGNVWVESTHEGVDRAKDYAERGKLFELRKDQGEDEWADRGRRQDKERGQNSAPLVHAQSRYKDSQGEREEHRIDQDQGNARDVRHRDPAEKDCESQSRDHTEQSVERAQRGRRQLSQGDVITLQVSQEEQPECAFTLFFANCVRSGVDSRQERIHEAKGGQAHENRLANLS